MGSAKSDSIRLVNAVHFLLMRSQKVFIADLLIADVARDPIHNLRSEIRLVQVETRIVAIRAVYNKLAVFVIVGHARL